MQPAGISSHAGFDTFLADCIFDVCAGGGEAAAEMAAQDFNTQM